MAPGPASGERRLERGRSPSPACDARPLRPALTSPRLAERTGQRSLNRPTHLGIARCLHCWDPLGDRCSAREAMRTHRPASPASQVSPPQLAPTRIFSTASGTSCYSIVLEQAGKRGVPNRFPQPGVARWGLAIRRRSSLFSLCCRPGEAQSPPEGDCDPPARSSPPEWVAKRRALAGKAGQRRAPAARPFERVTTESEARPCPVGPERKVESRLSSGRDSGRVEPA
ncbi:hypothetical protein DMC30DRAFT_390122 [Rhodotorula diobovata]|uniref:Uncharacterized protein n=1 Tax=Rhodotorula diobovata TaxID=5288 RepID=A0A5C5G4A9_9BASI|nr:hypothetical protein DMC30DRAFT_390122 [Rhodotorula diobovata]